MSWLKKRLPKKRWKRVCIYLLSLFVMLVAADMVLVQCWRHIDISPETTRITSPLNAQGLPDYVAARNAEASKGVTAENNAAPELLAIIGTSQFPKEWREQVFPQIGISPADASPHFVGYQDWQKAHMPATLPADAPDADSYRDKDWNQTMLAPWKSDAHPDRSGWLTGQHEALMQLDVALRKERFYVPWNSLDPAELTPAVLPWITGSRNCGYLLTADAMRAVGDGDVAAFQRDILDTVKLARVASQGSTSIEYLMAVAIEDTASMELQHGATVPFLSAEGARGFLEKWSSMPAFPDMSHVLDTGERFGSLNTFCKGSRLGMRAAMGGQGPPNLMQNLFAPIHYNGILRTFNRFFDEVVAANQLPTYKQRAAAMKAVEAESVATRNWLSIGDMLVAILVPSFGRSVLFQERGLINHDLATVALALRIYREEHGAFPASLAELSPGILAELPTDGFADDAPFHYRREGSGYVIYSVGDDGKDDGGRDRKSAGKGEGWDIVVRAAE